MVSSLAKCWIPIVVVGSIAALVVGLLAPAVSRVRRAAERTADT